MPDITYQFRFTSVLTNPNTFLYNTGPIESLDSPNWNRRQFYSVSVVNGWGKEEQIANNLPCPPCRIGPLSTYNYGQLADAAVQSLPGGMRVFAATKIFDYTITSLDWARKKLDFAAIGRAVDLLANAKRIEFFGFGASGIVAQDAQQKFPLFGVPCIAHQDSHQQFIAASMLKPGDAVVAISNTGSTRSLIEVARTAKERGATVIVITGSNSPLTRFCDVAVIAETLENTDVYTPTTSRLAALVIVDILSTSVALRKGEQHFLDVLDMKKRLTDMRTSGVI